MKCKLLCIILMTFVISSCGVFSPISVSSYINGYWGKWSVLEPPIYHPAFLGYVNDFVVYNSNYHPSEYAFKLEIPDLPIINFKKADIKKNEWYTYKGVLYIPADSSFESFCKNVSVIPPRLNESTKAINVKVKIMKTSQGYRYDVFSGNNGFALVLPWQRATKSSH